MFSENSLATLLWPLVASSDIQNREWSSMSYFKNVLRFKWNPKHKDTNKKYFSSAIFEEKKIQNLFSRYQSKMFGSSILWG